MLISICEIIQMPFCGYLPFFCFAKLRTKEIFGATFSYTKTKKRNSPYFILHNAQKSSCFQTIGSGCFMLISFQKFLSDPARFFSLPRRFISLGFLMASCSTASLVLQSFSLFAEKHRKIPFCVFYSNIYQHLPLFATNIKLLRCCSGFCCVYIFCW